MKIRNSKGGFLLPMVIIYALIMMITGFGILHLGALERISSLQRISRARAFYLAEAGVNRIISRVNQGKTLAAISPTTVTSGNWQGTYAVAIHNPGNPDYAIITGKVKNQTVKIRIDLEKKNLFSQAIFGNKFVHLKNFGLIDSYDSRNGFYNPFSPGHDGDIGSNLYIKLNNFALVRGDASVSTGNENDIVVGKDARITGDKSYSAPVNPLPPVNIPEDLQGLPYPEHGDPRISGNYTLNNGILTVKNFKTATISGGNFKFKKFIVGNGALVDVKHSIRVYIEKELKLKNVALLKLEDRSEFYIGSEGKVVISNFAKLNSLFNPLNLGLYIASTEEQRFENTAIGLYGGIYAPLAKVTVSNNANIFGSIVAKQIELKNLARVHYDVALRDISPPGGENKTVVTRWSNLGWKGRL